MIMMSTFIEIWNGVLQVLFKKSEFLLQNCLQIFNPQILMARIIQYRWGIFDAHHKKNHVKYDNNEFIARFVSLEPNANYSHIFAAHYLDFLWHLPALKKFYSHVIQSIAILPESIMCISSWCERDKTLALFSSNNSHTSVRDFQSLEEFSNIRCTGRPCQILEPDNRHSALTIQLPNSAL